MWPRLVIPGLLAFIVGVPIVLRSLNDRDVCGLDNREKLIIMTPHNEQIRYEFASGFNRWRSRLGKSPIHFDWRTSGGTSDLRKSVFDQFQAKIRKRLEEEGIGCDLFFGGGDYEHGVLARGIQVTRGDQKLQLPLTVPIELPSGMLPRVFPQPTIGSERLYHPDRYWIGVALSSFGIVYNRDLLREVLDVPEPRQWRDLADERYCGWIALADPAHSGSIAATYNAILRREGWESGWKMLRRVFANARYFTASASKVPVDVSAGEAAAGMCIDFYGRFQAGSIGGDRVGYVDPPFTTAITADPVSILRGAPHRALANEFVVWLLSSPAQQLWVRRATIIVTPAASTAPQSDVPGPEQFELRRLPIRRDVYEPDQMANWTDQVNPFVLAKAFPPGMVNFYRAVAPVAHAMAIDIHDDLRAAWNAILNETDPRKRKPLIVVFESMPSDLCIAWPRSLRQDWMTILEDQDHRDHDEVAAVLSAFMKSFKQHMKDRKGFMERRLEWTRYFRDRYREVVRLARTK